ncbi:hypothetical protein N0V83_004156 [Neocucurbitaria cava]|uniref:Uncharacterized protein n=1 Tax=Neocucurbitaria cava TaxID=798079 RepID=A0A9W9CN19_9PLEO|nr:hypothetical protein N0V83_004156 [Neocucurbitaria cava]
MLGSNNSTTVAQLSAQWANPSDVLSLLLIIGGDIVQTALAQTTGGRITPVCFSFGWVAYSFSTIVRVLGDGRLLPAPDYPVKVFNLESCYVRDNKNWVIGRILRDNEVFMNEVERHGGSGIRISIYIALPQEKRNAMTFFFSEVCWLLVTIVQVGIAFIPLGRDGEWGVFLITCVGVMAAFVAGQLPQWRIEKVPLKRKSRKHIALTSGNGSREIMIIYGGGVSMDLEELAAGESPRSDRAWEAVRSLSRSIKDEYGRRQFHPNKHAIRRSFMYRGLPVGLWITRFVSFCQVILWLALLITVAGLRSHTWYLAIVGSLGMAQNAMLAAAVRKPERRGLPLRRVDTIMTLRTMDGLMDLEATIAGAGVRLLEEFFPGFLREDENDWWNGERDQYDDIRCEDQRRGIPRSRLAPRNLDIPDLDLSGKSHLYKRSSTWGTMTSAVEEAEMRNMDRPPLPNVEDAENRELPSIRRTKDLWRGPGDSSIDRVRSPGWT